MAADDLLRMAALYAKEERVADLVSKETDPLLWIEEAQPCIETKTRGLVPFEPYDFQRQIIRMVWAGERCVIPKSRQIGVTTAIMVAFCPMLLYRYQVHGVPLHCHVLANKEEVAVERLLKIAKTALSTANLDPWQRKNLEGIDPKVKNTEIRYYTTDAQNYIRAHSGGATATRSFDGNAVLLEEVAHMPYAQEIWIAIEPMLDDMDNAPLFLVSTPGPEDDFFSECIENAREMGLIHIPLDWRAHPGRDDEWKQQTIGRLGETAFGQEHELRSMRTDDRAINTRLVEDHASRIPYLGDIAIPGHRYSKGIDLAGPGRGKTVHTAIDLMGAPAQVVYQAAYDKQSTPATIEAIEDFDARFPGTLFVEGNFAPAIIALIKTRNKKIAIRTRGTQQITSRIDPVDKLEWRNVPRALMLSWISADLETGKLIVHPDIFPDLFIALQTAQQTPGEKGKGKNVDELDSVLLADLGLTRRTRGGYTRLKPIGIPSDSRLHELRRRKW